MIDKRFFMIDKRFFMVDKRILLKEIESLPPHIIDEVYDYVTFLKQRKFNKEKIADITLASEDSLAKEWFLPEEDETWEDL